MNLDTYLRKHAVPQRAFAAQLGVTPAAVWNWINGVRVPKPRLMAAISAATGGKVGKRDFNGRAA